MAHKRPVKKGSFSGHFDELVKHFPHDEPRTNESGRTARDLKEKRDIHALLFEQAWRMDRAEDGRGR